MPQCSASETGIARLRPLPEGMSPSSALDQEVPPDLSTWLPTGSVDKRASREVVFHDSEAAASIHRPFICVTRPWTALARLTPSAYPPAPWTGYGGSLSCASFAGSSGLTRAGRPVIGLRRAPQSDVRFRPSSSESNDSLDCPDQLGLQCGQQAKWPDGERPELPPSILKAHPERICQ